MAEERLRVLRMVAEGRIGVEEGERLLEALGGSEGALVPVAQAVDLASPVGGRILAGPDGLELTAGGGAGVKLALDQLSNLQAKRIKIHLESENTEFELEWPIRQVAGLPAALPQQARDMLAELSLDFDALLAGIGPDSLPGTLVSLSDESTELKIRLEP